MKPKQTPKHQRIKIAALPVLLAILVYLLFAPAQPEPNSDDASTPTAQATPRTETPIVQAAPATTIAVSAWPEVDLKFLLQGNPLSGHSSTEQTRGEYLTSVASDPTVTARNNSIVSNAVTEVAAAGATPDPVQHLLKNLAGSPVKYVFSSNRQKAVMLGDQMLEEGSQLSDALHVHDIQKDLLVLKESRHPLTVSGWISILNKWVLDVGLSVPVPTPPTALTGTATGFN